MDGTLGNIQITQHASLTSLVMCGCFTCKSLCMSMALDDVPILNHTHLRSYHHPHFLDVEQVLLIWLHLLLVVRVFISLLKVFVSLDIKVCHTVIGQRCLLSEVLVSRRGVVLELVSGDRHWKVSLFTCVYFTIPCRCSHNETRGA